MFTVKFYDDSPAMTTPNRICEVDSLSIYKYENGSIQVTMHGPSEDSCQWLGIPPHPLPGGKAVYAGCIVENSRGKTTEILRYIRRDEGPTVMNAQSAA